MEEGQELREEGWQGHDLRSGIGKVFEDLKRRGTLGMRVLAAWGVVLFMYAAVNFAGAAAVAPVFWDAATGLAGLLFAALCASRTPTPFAFAGLLVLADVAVVGFGVPRAVARGVTLVLGLAGGRLGRAPVAR
jgi:hypothetical protein